MKFANKKTTLWSSANSRIVLKRKALQKKLNNLKKKSTTPDYQNPKLAKLTLEKLQQIEKVGLTDLIRENSGVLSAWAKTTGHNADNNCAFNNNFDYLMEHFGGRGMFSAFNNELKHLQQPPITIDEFKAYCWKMAKNTQKAQQVE